MWSDQPTINQSASQMLNNPMFWIKEFIKKGLSKENQKDWIKENQAETNLEKRKHIAAYRNWNYSKKKFFDPPCYTKFVIQEYFRMKIGRICNASRWNPPSNEETDLVKILAPLRDNPNALIIFNGWTLISWASRWGHTEIVKNMAPFTHNLNAPTEFGFTPIYEAANKGYTEIVKILAPLTENPNSPNSQK